MKTVLITGPNPANLMNDVSDAVFAATKRGMEVDEIVCCAATVLADYAREVYGDDYLDGLCHVIQNRKGQPLPDKA
jgi:hypothetical protein